MYRFVIIAMDQIQIRNGFSSMSIVTRSYSVNKYHYFPIKIDCLLKSPTFALNKQKIKSLNQRQLSATDHSGNCLQRIIAAIACNNAQLGCEIFRVKHSPVVQKMNFVFIYESISCCNYDDNYFLRVEICPYDNRALNLV